jgi:radical SAM protein with 4Fe4S-binding SPASM domain
MSLVKIGGSRHDAKADYSDAATRKLDGYRRQTYAVWEITLACNLKCNHCGSRAGEAREDELSTEECFDLVDQMAAAGIGEVSLIGGEAYLRADWLDIARRINERGMLCTVTTGGYGISAETARQMRRAGVARVSVSIDGLEASHDELRGVPGSWKQAFRALGHFQDAGLLSGTNTQINRESARDIPELYEHIRDAGASAWQLQLTVPMGNAADNTHLLLQPHELGDLYKMLARVVRRALDEKKVRPTPGNNIGYYGPYEKLFRDPDGGDDYGVWMGCQAGLYALGIEADGAIKGCPSLPTGPYTGGNIREHKLLDILETKELNINMGGGTAEGTAHMWGFCKSCQYAELCRGGCSWTSHVFFDRRGNNVYCHHRALQFEKAGVREWVRPKRPAPGTPFDNGEMEIWTESASNPLPDDDEMAFSLDQVRWSDSWKDHDWV